MHLVDLNILPFASQVASGVDSSYDSVSNGLNYSELKMNPKVHTHGL